MKLTLRQIRKLIISLIFLLVAGAIGYRLGQQEISLSSSSTFPGVRIERQLPLEKRGKVDFGLFWTVWDKLEENYLDQDALDPEKMVYGAISGMVAAAGDPYTVFLPPEENKEVQDGLRGDFEGVGIQIGYNRDNRLVVVAPLAGTPAERAGIKAGDVVARIVDEKKKIDKDTSEISLPQAVKDIRGPRGSKITLTIEREGLEKPFEVTLERSTIVVKSVEVAFREENNKKVAVLTLSRFGERTTEEWNQAVSDIKKNEGGNFAGVVLDLRNNPGGFLDGAVFVTSEFLSDGVVVQQDRGAIGRESRSVNRKGLLLKEPLVVLINNGSASASEIVAGALQESKRAKIVGSQSFGKGTVQEAQELENGAGLHVTVARWLLPSGKLIDQKGITPDEIVEINSDEESLGEDAQLKKAIELLVR